MNEAPTADAPTPSAAPASPAPPAATAAPQAAPAAPAAAPATPGEATQQPSTTNTTLGDALPVEKAEGDKPATDEARPDDKAAEKVVPEKYEFKAPEGMALDPELTGELEGVARGLELSQEQAQQVADLGVKLAQKFQAKQLEIVQQARTDWANQTRADAEIGGANVAQNVATAEKALTAFGTPELRALLKESGIGNHPEVIRAFYRVGKAISEDRVVTGRVGTPPEARRDAAAVLYGTQH